MLVIDEQELFRTGVRQVLSQYPNFDVTDCSPTEAALVETALPNIVLLGCQLTQHNGLQLGKRIARHWPNARLVVLSPNSDDKEMFETVKTSTVACVKRSASGEELVSTIRRTHSGERPTSDDVAAEPAAARHTLVLFEEIAPMGGTAVGSPAAPLTSRELQVLGYIANGNSNRQISLALDISEQTVKNHIGSVLRKLHAHSRAHAVVTAISHGLISAGVETPTGSAHISARGKEAVAA